MLLALDIDTSDQHCARIGVDIALYIVRSATSDLWCSSIATISRTDGDVCRFDKKKEILDKGPRVITSHDRSNMD